jgi:hypothetical protein
MNHESVVPSQISDMSAYSLDQMSRTMRRSAIRQVEQVAATGLAVNAREQVRSLLASTALQNVGTLSALEEHLIQIAPLGAVRYQQIVDAYTLGAAQTIVRW